jgi:hypothetical protein
MNRNRRQKQHNERAHNRGAAKPEHSTTQGAPEKPNLELASETPRPTLTREEVRAIATEVACAELNRAWLTLNQYREVVQVATTVAGTEIAKHTNALASATATPAPETLAMIAATLAKGGTEQPATAVEYAVKLYEAACGKLQSKIRLSAAYKAEAEKMASIPRPKQFPAVFDDFLRLIVRAKTLEEGAGRFRDYYRDQVKSFATMGHPEDYPVWLEWAEKKTFTEMTPDERRDPKWKGKTDKEIGAAKQQEVFENRVESLMEENKCGFSNETSWLGMAKQYLHWWDGQIRKKARLGGKARASKTKSKKSV